MLLSALIFGLMACFVLVLVCADAINEILEGWGFGDE